MRVLGVDPGLTRCGIGIVNGEPGRTPSLVLADVIRTPADAEIGQRLAMLERGLIEVIETHRPDAMAVERPCQTRRDDHRRHPAGDRVILLVGTRAGLRVVQHTPTEVKAAISGSGRADKAQVGTMVTRILRLTETPKPADAADAVALAICQLWRGAAQARLETALRRYG